MYGEKSGSRPGRGSGPGPESGTAAEFPRPFFPFRFSPFHGILIPTVVTPLNAAAGRRDTE